MVLNVLTILKTRLATQTYPLKKHEKTINIRGILNC